MKTFISMRNTDKEESGVAYEYSKRETLLEEMKPPLYSVQELKRNGEEKELKQRRKKEDAAKRVLASECGRNRNGMEDEEEIDDKDEVKSRGPKRRRLDSVAVDTYI